MAVTCKQIAEMLGVSRQAAASVLNNAPKCLVSPAKKEQILKLARELNYVHNNAARTLRKGKSGLIGILTGGLHIVRTGAFLIFLDKILRANGYLPIIIYTRSEYESIASGIKSLIQQNVDGIIVNGIPPSDDHTNSTHIHLERSGLLDICPTILTNCEYACERASVHFNYDNVIKNIIDNCTAHKFEQVQLFIRKQEDGAVFKSGAAMLKTAELLNLPILPERRIHFSPILAPPNLRNDSLFDIREALSEHRDGTLYLCETGHSAIQTAAILMKNYGGIPENTGIIAFDHTESCSKFTPAISSVELNFDLFALRSWELLEKCITSPEIKQIIDVPVDIILRETF